MRAPFSPSLSKEYLEKFLHKNYYKKKYDRFLWWRSYSLKTQPLTNRHPLKDRILNGDFDFGPYYYEAQLVEHQINEIHEEFSGDPSAYGDKLSLPKARRKRLLEDFEKDENSKLEILRRSFVEEFKMTKEQYDKNVIQYRGPDLINFYYRMEDKYGTRGKRPQRVPSFR